MEYNNKIPGPTAYDEAYIPEPENNKAEKEPVTETKEQNKFDIKRSMAIISLIVGLSSIAIVLFIPIFGLMIAGLGGAIGLVLGIISKKNQQKYARGGIISSVIALVLVLIGLIVLAILGWNIMWWFLSQSSPQQYYTLPGIQNGFYFR